MTVENDRSGLVAALYAMTANAGDFQVHRVQVAAASGVGQTRGLPHAPVLQLLDEDKQRAAATLQVEQ